MDDSALKIAKMRFAKTRNAISQVKVDSAKNSLISILNSQDRGWAEDLKVWIYDESPPSKETNTKLKAARKEHQLPSDDGYEVDVDPTLPEHIEYGPTIIDCELAKRSRAFKPALYELHTKYSKRSKAGLWALPATAINNKNALKLDGESKKYIKKLVKSFLKQHPEKIDVAHTIKQLEKIQKT